jgi:hypothetical protein
VQIEEVYQLINNPDNHLVMMNYGITSSRFFTGLILALTLFPMISCEKESFIPALTPEPVEPRNLAEAEHMPREKAHMQDSAFVFDIQENYCTQDGVHLSVLIDRPENYSFKWAIDGNHAGHNSYTPGCVCGNTATVFITRLSDGLSLRKTIDLPQCGPDFE